MEWKELIRDIFSNPTNMLIISQATIIIMLIIKNGN
jgi:hypothetical protein